MTSLKSHTSLNTAARSALFSCLRVSLRLRTAYICPMHHVETARSVSRLPCSSKKSTSVEDALGHMLDVIILCPNDKSRSFVVTPTHHRGNHPNSDISEVQAIAAKMVQYGQVLRMMLETISSFQISGIVIPLPVVQTLDEHDKMRFVSVDTRLCDSTSTVNVLLRVSPRVPVVGVGFGDEKNFSK